MAFEIDRRYHSQGLRGLAVHPGGIANTGLNRRTPATVLAAQMAEPIVRSRMKSAEQELQRLFGPLLRESLKGKGRNILKIAKKVSRGTEIQPFWRLAMHLTSSIVKLRPDYGKRVCT